MTTFELPGHSNPYKVVNGVASNVKNPYVKGGRKTYRQKDGQTIEQFRQYILDSIQVRAARVVHRVPYVHRAAAELRVSTSARAQIDKEEKVKREAQEPNKPPPASGERHRHHTPAGTRPVRELGVAGKVRPPRPHLSFSFSPRGRVHLLWLDAHKCHHTRIDSRRLRADVTRSWRARDAAAAFEAPVEQPVG